MATPRRAAPVVPPCMQDPTTENRQENDRGTQYASAIFTHNAKQAEVAARVKAQLQAIFAAGKIDKFATRAVTTAIRPASAFVAADADHQRYLEDNPAGYCELRSGGGRGRCWLVSSAMLRAFLAGR